MSEYSPNKIEHKWQKYWKENNIFKTKESSDKPKYYVLDMFPYPSGAGLHVGHPKGYIATDIVARMKMMQGFNVLHPMGWDAFGLPAENYAIKNKVHPAEATEENIKIFKKQLELLGFTYDWDREVNTTDPQYYRWTQWIFLQMFKRGLAYESYEPINWCPSCQTGLANEDLEDGKCERCGSIVEQKPMRQWVLKITDYAERLLNDLDKLKDWPESIKEMQRNWIGRSEGVVVKFKVQSSKFKGGEIEVFTTRLDTIFSGTYLILAPEHPFVEEITTVEQKKAVANYVSKTKNKTVLERGDLNKDKTGVFTGAHAINPASGDKMPIWISDFVIGNYGTGAVFADAHDERDFAMAKKYNLPLKVSIRPKDDELWDKVKNLEVCFSDEGVLVNSGQFDGLTSEEAREKIVKWLLEKGLANKTVNYKLRDWVFSRQRYWGEPIPLVHCEKCGVVAILEEELPLELPKVKNYEPTGTGESPLAGIEKWVNTKCPKCGGLAKRETNTMPQWAGSCWYYLAYCMSRSQKSGDYDWNKEKINYWNPVDFYVGGAEHATRHLIYARFWHKFLFDIGVVGCEEPFTRLQNVGLILAEDGRKMSKRWGNVINPDEVVKNFGADAMRVYEMFMGPFDQPCVWSTNGLVGAKRFLERVWTLQSKLIEENSLNKSKIQNPKSKIDILLHQTIKKVTEDISEMKFNTAVSQMMILANKLGEEEKISTEQYSIFIKLLSPFAPHICEELWLELGNKESILKSKWPQYDPELIKDEEITIAVQINGKLRDTIVVSSDISEDEVKKKVLESDKVQKWLDNKEPKKVIYVDGKLISIVV